MFLLFTEVFLNILETNQKEKAGPRTLHQKIVLELQKEQVMLKVPGRDRFAGHGRVEKYANEPSRLPKEIDQIIVDPSTKKRYLRGHFLGKVFK